VRTPLNQILGYTEMLQEEAQAGNEPGLLADLGKIHAAARQLLQQVLKHFGPVRAEAVLPRGALPAGTTTFTRLGAAGPQASPLARVAPAAGTLLVVDDDAANREMLARRLERLGHTVRLAAHGREALECLRRQPFDLVLLDLQMPGMSGHEVLARIKADPALRSVPVVVLSASDDSLRVAQCIELGAEDYLPKPFEPVLLQARLGACLEKKFLRDREVSHLRQIQTEKQRADELLRIILPYEVAEELKANKLVQPRRLENVAVLFCDIVGFTAWCEQHSPEEVLLHLQGVVQALEGLTDQHSLEKIKTLGDAFMAAAGLLTAAANPALDAVRCGRAMIEAARHLPPSWEVRVGVHAGPVIAGVVGRRKFQFDIWGDTVNTAMRMAQAAAPGALCVNQHTWRLLGPAARGCPQGRLPVKGKGDLELFHVEAVPS
jgi:CheY-like chemotaxis protein